MQVYFKKARKLAPELNPEMTIKEGSAMLLKVLRKVGTMTLAQAAAAACLPASSSQNVVARLSAGLAKMTQLSADR
jgi:hypothetical protein